MRKTSLAIALNEPLKYDRLLDISTDELEFLKNEADVLADELKSKIGKEYELIKPSLSKMRDWKQQLNLLREKREVYKTFLTLDGKDSFMSTLKDKQTNATRVSFNDLFTELEKDVEGEPKKTKSPSRIPIPKPRKTPK